MKSIKTMIADSIAKIIVGGIKRKSKILKEVLDNPDNVKIEAFIEGEDITIKITKKKGS